MRLYDTSKCDDMGWNEYQEFLQNTFGDDHVLELDPYDGDVDDQADWSFDSLNSSSDAESNGASPLPDTIGASELDGLAFDNLINANDFPFPEETVGDNGAGESDLGLLPPKRLRMEPDSDSNEQVSAPENELTSDNEENEHYYGQLPFESELDDLPEIPRANSLRFSREGGFLRETDVFLRRSLSRNR